MKETPSKRIDFVDLTKGVCIILVVMTHIGGAFEQLDRGSMLSCFRMASCINEDLGELERTLPKPELFVAISALIDKRIHANYRIFATNYVAHDLLYKEERFVEHYTAEDKKRFISYIDGQLERITLPNKDVDFLREKLLLMYANPLTNYLAATK